MTRAEARAVAAARRAESGEPQIVLKTGDGYQVRTVDGRCIPLEDET